VTADRAYLTLIGDTRQATAQMHQLGMQCLRTMTGQDDLPEVYQLADPAETRRRRLGGRCPCCGLDLDSWMDLDGGEHVPGPVTEDVLFCGRCLAQDHHHDPPGYLAALLAALVPPPPLPGSRPLP
jgi:hypothetical protein